MKTMHQQKWGNRRFLFIPLAISGLLAVSALIMILWNLLIPGIFHLSPLNFWQAMGLFALSRLLFGGFHFKRPDGHTSHFGNPALKEKFLNMTEDERQQFKEQWKSHCGR